MAQALLVWLPFQDSAALSRGEGPEFFPGIHLVSIIYVRYCHKIWGS